MAIDLPTWKDITGATNAAPIVITAASHGFASGDTVQIYDVGGNTAANGIWTITVVNANTFSLQNSDGDGNYTSGGHAMVIAGNPDLTGETTMCLCEATDTQGTDDIALAGSVNEGLPFATLEDGAEIEYRIQDEDGLVLEHGIGTLDKVNNILERTEIISTSEDEVAEEPADLPVGNKLVSTDVVAPESDAIVGSETDIGELVSFVDGIPNAQVRSILSVVNQFALTDATRCGPTTSTIYTVQRRIGSAFEALIEERSRLLQTSQPGPAAPALAALQITFREVNINGLSLALNAASPIPFDVDTNKIPAQATTIAKIPFDVFVYLPHQTPGLFAATPAPLLFYLNWYSSSARNNGNVGVPVGHDVVEPDNSGWSYLDVSGDFSTFIVGTNPFDRVVRRYLHLGTFAGLTNGTTIFQDNKRLGWNRYRRITYAYTGEKDPTDTWSMLLTDGGRNQFSRMNAATFSVRSGTVHNSPWSFYYVNGSGENTLAPLISVGATRSGNARIKVTAFDGENNPTELRNEDDTGDFITPDELSDFAGEGSAALVSGKLLATARGYRVYRVMSAVGSRGAGVPFNAAAPTPRFLKGDPNINGIVVTGEA